MHKDMLSLRYRCHYEIMKIIIAELFSFLSMLLDRVNIISFLSMLQGLKKIGNWKVEKACFNQTKYRSTDLLINVG